MPAERGFDDAPLSFDAPVAVLIEAAQLAGGAGLAVEVAVAQRPAPHRLVLAEQVDLRVGAVVQVDHPRLAGQLPVDGDEAVAVAEGADGAVVDEDRPLGEAVANRLDLLEVTGVEIAVLEASDIFQRFQAGNAGFQVHHRSLMVRLGSPQ
ncbi:hypothetical protein D3C86_1539170 [compost metagenome]